MRIENKYNRNKHFRNKHWKRVRHLTNPYEHTHGAWYYSSEQQVQHNFEQISQRARFIESGTHKHWHHASSDFRRILNKQRKAQERSAMRKICNGDYDMDVPIFKRDADWLYF